MGWHTIRKATEADHEKLNTRAAAFVERNALKTWVGPVVTASHLYVTLCDMAEDDDPFYATRGKRLLKNWRRVVVRALGHEWAQGICYGYVGYHD